MHMCWNFVRVQYDASAGVAMLRLEMQYQLNTGSPYIYNPAGSTPRLDCMQYFRNMFVSWLLPKARHAGEMRISLVRCPELPESIITLSTFRTQPCEKC